MLKAAHSSKGACIAAPQKGRGAQELIKSQKYEVDCRAASGGTAPRCLLTKGNQTAEVEFTAKGEEEDIPPGLWVELYDAPTEGRRAWWG